MHKHRFAALVMAASISLPALSGCGAKTNSNTTATSGEQEITFWYSNSGSGKDAINQLVSEFNAANKGKIKVKASYQGSYADVQQKFSAAVQSKSTPAILQNRLSQEQEAALVLKHAHWNVTGPNFIAVHEMLDPEVEAVLAQADETAERIATLGGTPDGRADAIVRNRTWKSFDAEGRVGTEEYLKALIEYYDAFIADDRKAIAELDELDVISSNVIQDHVQELEKFQWFMRSHLA